MRIFGKGKCKLIASVRIFGMGKCKFIANFSVKMVTSLPSLSLSLSLSLSVSLSLSHRKYLTHNIGSASAKLSERLPDLCFAICRFSQVRFITPNHLTHNLFFYFQ